MAIRIADRESGTVYIAYFKYQGRQYQKTLRTKAEAKAWEAEEKKRLKKQDSTPQSLLFSQACEVYLHDCEARMTSGTFMEKQCHLREFAVYLRADRAMCDVQIVDARRFLLHIKEARGNKAANRRLRTLKALWNWHRERVPQNPWKHVQTFAEEEYIKYVPPQEDVAKVLAVATPWQRALLEMLLHSGARLSEVLQLRWEDVSEATMQLWTQKRRNGSKERRVIPLDQTLQRILHEQRHQTGSTAYVFINPNTGRPHTANLPGIRYMLARLCEKAEVKAFGFHSIRHYFAVCLMESQRASLADIQLLLGHQRATTTDIYLRSMAPQLDYLADIIEGAVQTTAKTE